jgi:hypothetical protein
MMGGEERLEDLFPPGVAHTLAIVDHVQFDLAIRLGIANQQAHAADRMLRMPQGVAQKIPQHLMKMRTIKTQGSRARQLEVDHLRPAPAP